MPARRSCQPEAPRRSGPLAFNARPTVGPSHTPARKASPRLTTEEQSAIVTPSGWVRISQALGSMSSASPTQFGTTYGARLAGLGITATIFNWAIVRSRDLAK